MFCSCFSFSLSPQSVVWPRERADIWTGLGTACIVAGYVLLCWQIPADIYLDFGTQVRPLYGNSTKAVLTGSPSAGLVAVACDACWPGCSLLDRNCIATTQHVNIRIQMDAIYSRVRILNETL
jgi:hypothetical protein